MYEQNIANKPNGFGIRHMEIILLFFGLLISYTMRVNLSVGVVAMTDNKTNSDYETYSWSSETIGLILSSFFWGYVVSQIPASILATYYGPKIILFIAIFICSVLTLLIPVAASFGWEYLCASRALQGFCQGCVYPCTHALLAKWTNPAERGFLASITYSGAQLGVVVMSALSGLIAASSGGWPAIFYFSGGLSIFWDIVWLVYGSNSPAEYKKISKIEKEYLENSIGTSSNEKLPLPWYHIVKSVPFLALIIVHCGHNYGYYTLLTEIPSYMSHILKYEIKKNALLSALPYLMMVILGLIFSWISDYLMNHNCLSIGAGRKIFNSIGHWTPMVCLIGLGFVTAENASLGVVLLTIAVSVSSATNVGYLVNHMDLSPNFAGTLMAITNSLGNIASIIAPIIVGVVVYELDNASLWRIIFFITAAIYLIGNLIFVIFGSGEIQYWNNLSKIVKKTSA